MKKTFIIAWLICLSATCLFAQHSYFITSPDKVKLSVNEFGSGKPVVMLAGGPGMTATYLEGVYKNLPGYRVIVPDQRGTGKSLLPKIDATTISISKYVEDVEALRVYLKLPQIVLVGHSWGGMLAMAYTAKHPDKVAHLIVLSSGSAVKDYDYFPDNIMMRLTPEEQKGAASPNGLVGFKAIYPGYFYSRARALATRHTITPASFGQQTDKINENMYIDYRKTSASRVAALRKYKGPVNLIQGRQDPMDEATAYQTKGILPQTQLFFIEKCGHMPWLEEAPAPQTFFTELKKVLQ
jgi:proline iminopeptidase